MYFFRKRTWNRNYNAYFYEPFGGAMTLEQAYFRCSQRAGETLSFTEIEPDIWRTEDEEYEIVYKPY